MNKEVIFVINKLHGGGAERVISIIADYMSKKNMKTIICTYNEVDKKYIESENIKYEVINPNEKINFIKKIKRISMLRRIFKSNKNATIISFEYFVNMQVIISSILLKNRVIISERNDPNILNKRFILKKMRDFLYNKCDVLVCQTEEAKLYFNKKIQSKSVIIPNPIMENLPNRYEGERKKEIVSFSRIEPQKNIKMTIDAFVRLSNKYPDYILSIYGDGSMKNDLIKYVESIKFSDKIRFFSFKENIHELIVDKSMFISSSNYEGMSNSMLEALAIGLPSIVTDCPCGGSKEVIKNNINGILIKVGDENQLYENMKLIIDNKEFSKKLSINATKVKKIYDKNKIGEIWINLI